MFAINAKRFAQFLAIAALFVAAFNISGCAGVAAGGKTSTSTSQQTTASSAAITTQASAVNFGSVAVGNAVTRSIFFLNTGSSNAAVSNVIISGAGYSISGVTNGEILTPGETVQLNITLAPSAAGNLPGSLTLADASSNATSVVALVATGVQPSATSTSTSHSVTLKWNPSTSTVAGYNSYRSTTSGGPYTKMNSTLLPTEEYVDSSVQGSQTYFYVTTSVDSANVESIHSNEVSVTIPAS